MGSFFEVCVKGFRGLMTAKPKWHFVRELISNSLDEVSVEEIKVRLVREPRYVTICCKDDGDGFERLSDAYTLYAHTKKRSDAEVRGRFNMGEKELASFAKEMTIETTTGKVVFKDDKRKDHHRTKRENGTKVTAKIPCSRKDFAEMLWMVGHFIIPKGKSVHIRFRDDSIENPNVRQRDWYETHVKENYKVEETLETTLFDKKSGGMRPTKRKTEVSIYRIDDYELGFNDPYNDYGMKHRDRKAFLYELGIPVQEIECDYSVNVNQKIPMNANRDSVKDSYLRDIYALVLNAVHDKLDEYDVSKSWVRNASDDDLVSDDAFQSLQEKRYGKNAVMWSSDLQANEDAVSNGYAVIHGKTMSPVERKRFNNVGMVSSALKFKRGIAPTKVFKMSDWTESMCQMDAQCKAYANLVRIALPKTRFIESPESSQIASYNKLKHEITFNVSHMGGVDFDHESVENIATMIHEFAHVNVGSDPDQIELHGKDFYDAMAKHGALLFKVYLNEALELLPKWEKK